MPSSTLFDVTVGFLRAITISLETYFVGSSSLVAVIVYLPESGNNIVLLPLTVAPSLTDNV